jgi:hypothetical protein
LRLRLHLVGRLLALALARRLLADALVRTGGEPLAHAQEVALEPLADALGQRGPGETEHLG